MTLCTELLSADKTESGREVTVHSFVKVNSHELEDNDDTITAQYESTKNPLCHLHE
jgi:hypothetical protein